MIRAAAVALCLALALGAFWLAAHAAPIESASIAYEKFLDGARILEVPGEKPTDALALSLLIAPVGPVYWSNRVHALGVGPRVRWVGWQYEAGLRFAPVDVYFSHHSEHALDREHPLLQPVSNSVAIRWRIYP